MVAFGRKAASDPKWTVDLT